MPTAMKTRRLLLSFIVLSCTGALADDAYYQVPLTSLTLVEGKWPEPSRWSGSTWQMLEALQPYAVLDGQGEVYVSGETMRPWGPPGQSYQNSRLSLRVPRESSITGRLFVPKSDLSGMVALKFKFDAASATPVSKEEFFKAKEDYYRNLRQRNIPGGAWFRHQETEAAKARGAKIAPARTSPFFNPRRPRPLEDDYDSTYDLFSGGHALSENLQLDRLMAPAPTNATLVALSNITGITVREMDWKPLLQEHKPALDALASYVPFDQHALFFPSFEAMSRWIDEADKDGTPGPNSSPAPLSPGPTLICAPAATLACCTKQPRRRYC